MSLSHWKDFDDFFRNPWRHSHLVPYWRRYNPWRDDFGFGFLPSDVMSREFRDFERRTRELERRLHSELTEIEPADGEYGLLVSMDVQAFSPEEITVKTTDTSVTIEGKHEERKDHQGYISRQFTRRYSIPQGCDPSTITSELSSDGILTVKALKSKALENNVRIINIQHTGPACPPQLENKAIDESK